MWWSGRLGTVLLVGAVIGALLGTLTVLAGPAPPAGAHALLVAAVPAQGSVIESAPTAVRLTFNEPVQPVPGRIQVIAPDGKRINDGDPHGAGADLVIPLRGGDRPQGTYLVSYRVISADSHPIGASYTFSVGVPSESPPRPVADEGDPVVNAALVVARFLGYIGLLLAIGPILLLGRLWPRRLSAVGPLRLARGGLVLVAASTVGSLWAQVPYVSGATLFDVSGAEFRQLMTSQFGVVMMIRLLVVAAAAALLGSQLRRGSPLRRGSGRHRSRWAVLIGLAAVGLATWPLAGHPGASPQPWVMTVAGVVHLAGLAVWLGGLVTLLAFLLRRAEPRELGVILPAWSRWAALAVYFLVAGGVVQALVEAGPPHLLGDHRYGQLLLLKLGLLVAVLAVAGYARQLVRRRVADRDTPRRLRRALFVEVAVTAVVLVASAMLAQTVTGRVASFEAVATSQAEGFATGLDSPIYSVQLEIFPGQLGEYNTFHAFVYAPDGTPLEPVEWTVTTTLPEKGIEPIDHPVVTFRENEGIGAVNFPFAGEWELRLTIRLSDIDQATVSTTVPIS